METKLCIKCGEVKFLNEFYNVNSKNFRYIYWCKECNKEYVKKAPEIYYEWLSLNIQKNHQEILLLEKKIQNKIKKRLSSLISTAIWYSLKGNKNGNHWETLVNFTLQDLINHLEKLFKPGMNWNNQGRWHIDHKRPKSNFNFTSYNDPEFKECWALDNLQPLWAVENISKGNRII